MLGVRVPGAARPRRERERRRDPAHQARERGMGAGPLRSGAAGADLYGAGGLGPMIDMLTVDLLEAWGDALGQPPIERDLRLVALILPGVALDELASMPVGAIDRELLQLRSRAFGHNLV